MIGKIGKMKYIKKISLLLGCLVSEGVSILLQTDDESSSEPSRPRRGSMSSDDSEAASHISSMLSSVPVSAGKASTKDSRSTQSGSADGEINQRKEKAFRNSAERRISSQSAAINRPPETDMARQSSAVEDNDIRNAEEQSINIHTGVENPKVRLVIERTGCGRAQATNALMSNGCDVGLAVESIKNMTDVSYI